MPRPNFVFIMTDTQGANCLSCYERPALGNSPAAEPGGLDLGTECLDRLAEEGVRFSRAYTTCPVCTPARSGIFTGLTPAVNGAHTNNLAPGWNIRHMGQHFRSEGYRAAYIGKWHLDGLDYFDTGVCPDSWEDQYWFDGRRYLDELTDQEVADWRNGARDKPAEFTWAHRNGNRAEKYLREAGRADRPFLLCVSYDEPHGPHVCPPEYTERFRDFDFPIGPAAHDPLTDKPLSHREWAEATMPEEPASHYQSPAYFGCNSFVDTEIGRVVRAVERYAPENTWIIYTSDHGSPFGAHRIPGKGPAMYEETCRIPLIVRPPADQSDWSRGRVHRSPVSHLDILPTMRALAGLEVPPIYPGENLVPLLGGESGDPDRAVPIEFTRFSINHDGWGGYQPIRAIVRGHHKLVINLLHTDELYDLQTDPAELNNLIEDPDHADIRNDLHDALLGELDRLRDPFRGYAWERRPWRRDRRMGWNNGVYRHRPPDGFSPLTRSYQTARPPSELVEKRS